MKEQKSTRRRAAWIVLLALVTSNITVHHVYAAPTDEGDPADINSIRKLIADYAAAVNVEPVDLNLLSQVWLNSPEVSAINPAGEEHGWEEIKRDFYQNLMERLFSERALTIRDMSVHAYADSGWAEFRWRFVAKSRANRSSVESNGVETQIYKKIVPGRWALVHVHYSAISGGK